MTEYSTILDKCPIQFNTSTTIRHQVRRLSHSELIELRDYLIENSSVLSNINEMPTKYLLELVFAEIEKH